MILIVFILTFLIEGSFSQSDNGSVYRDLRTKILTGYDKNIRPVKDYDQPVNVSVLISLERLINVDTRTSTITFEAYMVLNWTDEFLVWNPNDYQGIDHINLSPSLIWKPDVTVSVSWTRYYEQEDLDVKVKSDGQVLWLRVLIVSFRCAMDLSDYPFDKQQCFFLVLTKFDTTNTVLLHPYSDDKSPVLNMAQEYNPEWSVSFDRNILSNTTNRNDTKQYIFVSMTMKRKSSAYHYILVMPYFSCNMLILYAFMLPQSSRRRLFLGSLALFIDLMLLMLVGYELGFDSNHNTPYAVKCLSINIVMVSLFIVISIFGSRYISKSTSQAPLWVQGLVKNGFIGKFLLIHVSSKELADIDSEMAKLNNRSQSSTETAKIDQRSSDWILLTAILDRLFFIVYTISFIIYHS